jgi:hypothetical protein
MKATVRQFPSRATEGDIILDWSNRAPLIPPGEYDVIYVHHETARIFQSCKAFVWFRIVTPGPAHNVMVYRAYRVRALTTKPGKNGGFKAARGSDVFHDIGRILDVRMRPDRVSAKRFAGIVCRAQVRTVVKDYKQRPIPEWSQYSVVEKLIHAETETRHLAVSG